MRKELITNKEAICLLMIFYFGSSLILGIGGEAKNDAWISGIVGIFMALPMILIYSRILSLFPGKDLFEILEIVFGKIIGKIFTILYVWYSFHLGALVIRNFGEFINTVSMPETPMLVPMFCLTIICILGTKSGVEVLARSSALILPLFLFMMIVVQIMGLNLLEIRNLRPIFSNGVPVILKGGATAFSFPFAESVVFLGIFSSLKTKNSLYKVFIIGTLFAGLLIIIITLRNILTLGGLHEKVYFPEYVAVSRIKIGDFIERIELSVALVFVVGAFIKVSICLLVACKGITSLFRLDDYRSIVIQVGLLMLYFSFSLYNSIMEMSNWAFQVYFYYAFPFQVIFPIILFVTSEIKERIRN